MSDLRTAAQQALEALTAHADLLGTMYLKMDAITALRAALAQQAEPVSADDAYRKWLEDTHAPALRRMDSQGAFAAGWKAALEQQDEPAQEPVAWRFKPMIGSPWALSDDGYYISCKRDQGYIVEALGVIPTKTN